MYEYPSLSRDRPCSRSPSSAPLKAHPLNSQRRPNGRAKPCYESPMTHMDMGRGWSGGSAAFQPQRHPGRPTYQARGERLSGALFHTKEPPWHLSPCAHTRR